MRGFVVTVLAVAILACLAQSVSAGGYGHQRTYATYRPPQFAYRYMRQRYLVHPGSGHQAGYQGYQGYPGYGSYGSYGAGAYGAYGAQSFGGALAGTAVNTGFSLIWWIIIIMVILFIIASID